MNRNVIGMVMAAALALSFAGCADPDASSGTVQPYPLPGEPGSALDGSRSAVEELPKLGRAYRGAFVEVAE